MLTGGGPRFVETQAKRLPWLGSVRSAAGRRHPQRGRRLAPMARKAAS